MMREIGVHAMSRKSREIRFYHVRGYFLKSFKYDSIVP